MNPLVEPPISPEDTQPCDTASPMYRVAPGPLHDLEIRLRDLLSQLAQFALNGIHLPIEHEVEFTYQQVVRERMRRDALIDLNVRFFSLNPHDKDE